MSVNMSSVGRVSMSIVKAFRRSVKFNSIQNSRLFHEPKVHALLLLCPVSIGDISQYNRVRGSRGGWNIAGAFVPGLICQDSKSNGFFGFDSQMVFFRCS